MEGLREADLFNANVLPTLEKRLEQQITDGTYDPQANRAILRLYQLYPERARDDVVVQILAKAFMTLPENDFVLAQSLVPVHLDDAPAVSLLAEMHADLQAGRFSAVWKATQDDVAKQHFATMKGFDSAIRKFIATILGITYTKASVSQVREFLNQPDIDKAAAEYGWTVEGDKVVFPPSAETRPRPQKATEEMGFSDLKGLMRTLLGR